MAQLAIINAPASFTTIWGFIKPWLAKETLAKIDILGTDYKDVLLEQIPAENLPESLGGTCTCAEAGGCRLSNAGPWMHNRTLRREKWLRSERSQLGLGMEGEDEDDEDESGTQVKVTTEQLKKQSEEATRHAEECAVVSKSGDEKLPADVPPEAVQNSKDRQRSFAKPEPSIPPAPALSNQPAQLAPFDGTRTTAVATGDIAPSRPVLNPSMTTSTSSSSASSSSFHSALSSFESAESVKTGTSATTGTSGTATTDNDIADSKRASIRKKLRKPLERLGLGTLLPSGRTDSDGLAGSATSSMFGSISRGTSRSSEGTKASFWRNRHASAERVSQEGSQASSLDAGRSPANGNVNGHGLEANSPQDAPVNATSPVASPGESPTSTRVSSAEGVTSVKDDVYENHTETMQLHMVNTVEV